MELGCADPGLLLRVDVVNTINGLYLFAVPKAVSDCGSQMCTLAWTGTIPVKVVQLKETFEVESVSVHSRKGIVRHVGEVKTNPYM